MLRRVTEGSAELRELDDAIRTAGRAVLVPQRLLGGVALPEGLVLVDRLALGGGALLAVLTGGGEVIAAPLVLEGGRVRRADAGDGAFEGLLARLRQEGSVGRFEARCYGPVPDASGERAVDADQSNDSFVVGDGTVVKLYPRTPAGAQPGLDVPAHLRAVGFDETPMLLGSLVWHGPDGDALSATASTFLPGARDGWDWYVDLVANSLDADADAIEPAATIGGLVARMHAALATPSDVFPAPVREAGPADVAGWRARALATLEEALEVTAGEEGERLRGLAARARHILEHMGGSGPVMRIHGDLHVGQMLRWDGGLAVSDFDGNPLAPADVRMTLDTPMRDVASMARALDHVGRVAQKRRPKDTDRIEAWIRRARRTFVDSYEEQIRAAGNPVPFVEQMLLPLEVAQECHEYVYAARYLPRWLYVPDLAMPALLQGD